MQRFPHVAGLSLLLSVQAFAQVPPRVANTTLQMPPQAFSSVAYQLENLNPGDIGEPVDMVSPPGDSRLFVVDRAGIIRVIPDLDNPVPQVFLDLTDRVEAGFGEEGLLGLAFHPEYATNGRFFVFYTRMNPAADVVHDDVIARFQVSAGDPNSADAASETILIRQPGDQWGRNHNGGDLAFGTDGYLHASLGDGGNYGNARHIDGGFYAAMLRLDVDELPGSLAPNAHPSSIGSYRIPPDNPFVGATSFHGSPVDPSQVRTEFFAVGLRNPWRFSIDPPTGAILLGDVGEGSFEEVNSIVSGANYGWPYREGTGPGELPPPAGASFIDPINAYDRDAGLSVIGGFVYRGTRLPELNGRYFFSDWGNGEIRALLPDGNNAVPYSVLATSFGFGPTAIAPDPRNGDVLVCDNSWAGSIRRLVRNPSGTSDNLPATLGATGAFADLGALTPNPGILPYEINVPFWSDDAVKSRWFSVPDPADAVGFDEAQPWAFPEGAVWIKHFEIEMIEGDPASRRRLETRFLVKTATGVYGATYRWNTAQTDADLVPEEGASEVLARTVGGTPVNQRWDYPSRGSCLSCHTPGAGHALGFGTAQLNLDRVYGGETHNQLNALALAGYLDSTPPPPPSLHALAPADDAATSVEFRARSYLQSNCAQCHDGGNSGIAQWDARLGTPLGEAGIIDGALNNTAGDPANRVIAPGDAAHSMLLTRISTRGAGQMPPLASHVVDDAGVALITAWIAELAGYQDYDAWSIARAGSVLAKDADGDGDGLKNLGEWLLDRHPLLASERWGVDALGRDALDRPTIHFQRTANRAILVEYNDDLQGEWLPLDVPGNELRYPATGGPAVVTDITPGIVRRFYRVKLLVP